MSRMDHTDAVIVGAGVAGLSLAVALREKGTEALVLERAPGVGGRCATRRVQGRPVDHGVPFLHGRHPAFLASLDAVEDGTRLDGWPAIRAGGGLPCQPEAFEGADRLLAFREGLTRFPKHLARGRNVRLGANVTALRLLPDAAALEVIVEGAAPLRAPVVALTMPAPKADQLLQPLAAASRAVAGVLPLLRQIRTIPCLAVIACYDAAPRALEWDVCYPLSSTMVHAIIRDSAKREADGPLTLVVQGRPRFSREYLAAPVEEWAGELLWEAGEFLGDWVERPSLRQEHAWHHARVEPATELSAPIATRLENGAVLALCGDGFSSAMGLEGAFLSGRSLADRLETEGVLPAASTRKDSA